MKYKKQNNLGLIKLKAPVNFTQFVFPACLNTESSPDDGDKAYFNAGFGSAIIDGNKIEKSIKSKTTSAWRIKMVIGSLHISNIGLSQDIFTYIFLVTNST